MKSDLHNFPFARHIKAHTKQHAYMPLVDNTRLCILFGMQFCALGAFYIQNSPTCAFEAQRFRRKALGWYFKSTNMQHLKCMQM